MNEFEPEEGELPQKESKTIVVSKGGCLKGSWGLGNQVFFHNGNRASPDQKETKHHSHHHKGFTEEKWDTYDSNMKTLLIGWHGIFTHIQKTMATKKYTENNDNLDYLYSSSRKYRSELMAMIASLHKELAEGKMDEEKRKTVKLFEYSHIIWHLCEIFMVDPNANITSQMINWIQQSVPVQEPDSKDGFWDAVIQLTIQGRTRDAIEKLKMNSTENPEAIKALCNLYSRCPSTEKSNRSLTDLMTSFKDWKDDVRQEQKKYGMGPGINAVFSILLGNSRALEKHSKHWYELLVAKLIYQQPEITKEEVQWLAKECHDKYKELEGELHNCLLAIFQGHVYETLQVFLQLIDFPWLLAHLADLLHHANRLTEDLKLESDESYRQFCLIEYGSSIMAHPTLWQLSLDYFSQCGRRGRAHIRKLVENQPLANHRMAYKLFSICDTYGLADLRQAICKQMGVKAIRRKRLGEAVNWFVEANDADLVMQLCNKFFTGLIHGHEVARDIASIGLDLTGAEKKAVGIWASLTLMDKLQKFCTFRTQILTKAKESLVSKSEKIYGELHALQCQAMRIVVQIVSDKMADKSLWFDILYEAARIMELSSIHNRGILTSKSCLKLQSCLEEVCVASRIRKRPEGKMTSKKVRAMRLAFCRGLSRATISGDKLQKS